jgi:Recombinase zinc beta ribbon domain
LVANDLYRPHTSEEMAELVAPQVRANLDPEEQYGIHWFNRKKTSRRTVAELAKSGGRRYRKRSTVKWRPQEEWIAVPVPTYLPRALVDRARAALENNKGYERKHLARDWELRGLVRCRCGSKMRTQTTKLRGGRTYYYYTCLQRRSLGKMCSCTQKTLQATEVEPAVWAFVSGLLKDCENIRAGMEALIEQERTTGSHDPAGEAEVWRQKIAECSHLRRAYQDQQAAGLMTVEELRERLEELENTRKLAQAELEALAEHEECIKELEKDRDALLQSMPEMAPSALEGLRGKEKNRLYRMLQLEVNPPPTRATRFLGLFVLRDSRLGEHRRDLLLPLVRRTWSQGRFEVAGGWKRSPRGGSFLWCLKRSYNCS